MVISGTSTMPFLPFFWLQYVATRRPARLQIAAFRQLFNGSQQQGRIIPDAVADKSNVSCPAAKVSFLTITTE